MWNKVEKILKQKHLSIYRLSKMTGIHETTLRNYRKNYSHPGGVSPSFKNACKIADALGVSLDALRGDKKCNH